MKAPRGYSLISALAAVAILGVAISGFGRLFADGWVTSQRLLQRGQAGQVVMMLAKAWPREIHGTRPETWRVEAGVFRAGALSIRQDGKRLRIARGASERRIFLGDWITCRFAVEKTPGMEDCAVMNVSIRPLDRNRKAEATRIRIVGCGRRPAS